jgi:hypothetical protein
MCETRVSAPTLAAALGIDRSTLLRALDSAPERFPAPELTPGGHRRWPLDVATAIVLRERGKLPAGWPVSADVAA